MTQVAKPQWASRSLLLTVGPWQLLDHQSHHTAHVANGGIALPRLHKARSLSSLAINEYRWWATKTPVDTHGLKVAQTSS